MTVISRAGVLALTAALALSLSACGSAESPTPAASTADTPAASPTAEATPEAASEPSIESVLEILGVADFSQSPTVAPFATRWGSGTFEGSRVQVYEFADQAAYEGFLESVESFGITPEQLIRTGNIVVSVDAPAGLENARALLAG